MAGYQPSEDHIHLFHFQIGFYATTATTRTCDIYGDVLKVVNMCAKVGLDHLPLVILILMAFEVGDLFNSIMMP